MTVYVYACLRLCMSTSMYVYVCLRLCMSTSMYVYVCLCLACLCMSMHVYVRRWVGRQVGMYAGRYVSC